MSFFLRRGRQGDMLPASLASGVISSLLALVVLLGSAGGIGASFAVTGRDLDPVSVGIAEADVVVDPTGTGDAFRAGFLTGTAWGLGLERAAQVGSLVATHCVEALGPQDYVLGDFLARFEKAFGADAAAEVAPHLQPR